jgi:hypothetical protein
VEVAVRTLREIMATISPRSAPGKARPDPGNKIIKIRTPYSRNEDGKMRGKSKIIGSVAPMEAIKCASI